MVTKKELIGKEASIYYNNKWFIGKIVDETKNTICLETEKKVVKIIKSNSLIKINSHIIQGEKITKRPEERIKAC